MFAITRNQLLAVIAGGVLVVNAPMLTYTGMMYHDISKSIKLSKEFKQKHMDMPIRISVINYKKELNTKYGSCYEAPIEEVKNLYKMQDQLTIEYTELHKKCHPQKLYDRIDFYHKHPYNSLFYEWMMFNAYSKEKM